jgi:SAM-dependent methyltransferase
MKKELQPIQHLLRQAHLLNLAEYGRYLRSVLQYYRRNEAFITSHPEFVVPPSDLAYDAYSAPYWEYYYRSGMEMAEDLANLMKSRGLPLDCVSVLEWGCGPGRIIRRLPDKLGARSKVYGADYNSKSIQWSQANIDRVQFCKNDLSPPLPFENQSFVFVYACWVFIEEQDAWLARKGK